jgi:hypothetical protein
VRACVRVQVNMLHNSLVLFMLVWYKQDAFSFNYQPFEERLCISMPSVIPFVEIAC